MVPASPTKSSSALPVLFKMVKIEKILLVATSTSRLGDTDIPTGAW
jgi:hypothetical protein